MRATAGLGPEDVGLRESLSGPQPCDPTHTKCPEQARSQRQKAEATGVGEGVSGGEGGAGKGRRASGTNDGKLGNHSDGCTAL